jgi:purine catabolism regulator
VFHTLETVLSSPSLVLGQPRVLVGAAGLQRHVRWIHSSEVLEIASLLRGGELLLTGGQMLAQATPEEQRRYIRELADRQVAAVAIETGPGLPAIPPAILEEAAAHDFPVVELRRRIPFVDVAEAVNGELVNESVTRLRLGGELAHAFSALLAQGADVQALVGLLVERTGAAAAVYDGQGRLITEQLPEGDHAADQRPPAAGADLTSRITVRGAHTASLVLSPPAGADPELLSIASERACEALGLALLRSHPPSTRDLAGGELARLACEPAADADRLIQLGRVIGFSPDDPVVCIALATTAPSAGLPGLDGLLRGHGRIAMDTTDTGAHIVLSLPDRRHAARHRNALVDQLRSWVATIDSVAVGVGPAVPRLTAAATSMDLAASAIRDRPAYGPGWLADATASAVTALLDAPELRARRDQFVQGQLGMLLTLPAGERERLLDTLETYFDQGCNKTRTAAVLHLQRQSLYGRLDRAFELLGGDPTGTARGLPLHLALRLRDRPPGRPR